VAAQDISGKPGSSLLLRRLRNPENNV